jgi:hypothetical protein
MRSSAWLRAVQHRDDAGAGDAGTAADAEALEKPLDAACGFALLERELRLFVQAAPQRDQFVRPARRRIVDSVQQIDR